MFLFSLYCGFNVMWQELMWRYYSRGTCGFGRQQPQLPAAMQAICEKYEPSVKAYLIIPIVVGALDFSIQPC